METLMPSDGNGDVPLNRQSSYLIEKTVRIHQQAPDFYSDIKVITRSHWIPSEQRPCCSRKKCRKKFTFMERPHHCRRCGEVFCWECTQFRRRLNKLANPDPDGGEYKVCQECYNQGPQGVGARRSLLEEYQQARRVCKDVARAREMGERRAGWRNRLDLEKECQRLIAGFKAELNRWEITKALTELKKMVTLPEWQKGMNYLQEDLNTTCQTCGVVFNRLLNKKHHCRVCALAVCTKCSTQDLLLYIPDSKMPPAPGGGLRIPAIMASTLSNLGDLLWRPSLTVEPELAIIEIVGCPDKEPNISIYLRVCEPCKTALTDIQVKKHRNSVRLVEDDFLTKLQKLFEEFWDLRKKIDHRLDKYFTTIDSLENNSAGSQQKGVQSQSNMKVLAKAQSDLSDFFTAYIMKVQQLKQLKQLSQTPAQGKLYQAFVKSKCEYYMENMYTFRNGRKKLAAISPPEMLELIQKIVDKDAIVSSHLYIKQLLFEALHLTQKHKVLNDLPAALLKLEQTMEKEVELCLKRQQEDWEEHLSLMEQILQSQIKHRKLIRPSRRQSLRSGSSHIYEIIKLRSGEVAEKILYQLEMKSAYNSFPKSVAALREFRDVLDVM